MALTGGDPAADSEGLFLSWPDAPAAPIPSWVITSVADGDVIVDDEIGRTPLVVAHADGTVSGNTGCSTIAGNAALGDDGVEGFDVSVSGPSCPDEHRERERTILSALNDGSAPLGHAGSFPYGVDGGAIVVLVALD